MGNLLSKVVALVLCILVSRLIFEKFEKPLTDMRPASTGGKASQKPGRPQPLDVVSGYQPIR